MADNLTAENQRDSIIDDPQALGPPSFSHQRRARLHKRYREDVVPVAVPTGTGGPHGRTSTSEPKRRARWASATWVASLQSPASRNQTAMTCKASESESGD